MFLRNRTPRRQGLDAAGRGDGERRSEERLRYFWPVWFSADGSLDIEQGRMVDLSSSGVSFLAPLGSYPLPGDRIWLRSSYPIVEEGTFGMESFSTVGRVVRTEAGGAVSRRIAVQFAQPLERQPAEAAGEAAPAIGARA